MDPAEKAAQWRQTASTSEHARKRAAQSVEHAEAILDASRDRARRARCAIARLDRLLGRTGRGEEVSGQEAGAATGWATHDSLPPARQDPGLADLTDRMSALRSRTAAAASRLAETEERAARIYDELAARDPGNPAHQRLANEARNVMRRARETERKYANL